MPRETTKSGFRQNGKRADTSDSAQSSGSFSRRPASWTVPTSSMCWGGKKLWCESVAGSETRSETQQDDCRWGGHTLALRSLHGRWRCCQFPDGKELGRAAEQAYICQSGTLPAPSLGLMMFFSSRASAQTTSSAQCQKRRTDLGLRLACLPRCSW